MRLDNLLSAVSLVRPAMGGIILRRAIGPIVILLALAVLAGVLVSLMLMVGLFAFYHYLLSTELSPYAAMGYTVLAAFSLLLITVFSMYRVITHTRLIMRPQGTSEIVQSFLDGFHRPPRPHR